MGVVSSRQSGSSRAAGAVHGNPSAIACLHSPLHSCDGTRRKFCNILCHCRELPPPARDYFLASVKGSPDSFPLC